MAFRCKSFCAKLVIIIVASFFCFSAASVYAEDACDITGVTDPLICGTKGSNEEAALQNKVKNVLEVVYLWVGIIAVVAIVIGGVKYMTSTGDSNKVQGAKRTITYSLVGLVVTIGAFAITEAVIGALDGKTPEETVADSGGSAPSSGGPVEVKALQIVGLGKMAHDTEYGFRAKIIPDYATNKTITWKSSNPKVATVSETGRVKALKPGTTTITATSSNGKVAEKTVTVPEPILVSSVSISAPTSITTGSAKTQLTATVLPRNAENPKLKWSLSKASQERASINQNGVISLKKDNKGKYQTGNIMVTAKTSNGVKDTVKIAIKNRAEEVMKERVQKLQDTVKKYAWEYCGKKKKVTDNCITTPKAAYKAAASKYKTSYNENIFYDWANGIDGSACVSYVITVMRDSGWDPNFVIGSVGSGAVSSYFGRTNSRWHNITSKLANRSIKPEPGDVILHYGGLGNLNHILLYSGKIPGFVSTTTSASLGGWVPRSDNGSIYDYINGGYKIWRYTPDLD